MPAQQPWKRPIRRRTGRHTSGTRAGWPPVYSPVVDETLDQAWTRGDAGRALRPLPGLLLVFSVNRPLLVPVPVPEGGATLGRGRIGSVEIDDGCMSRRHAEVTRGGAEWRVRDLGSRNGTAVDGVALAKDGFAGAAPEVLRVGDTLLLFLDDLRPFVTGNVEAEDGVLIGPTLRRTWDRIADAARAGDTLHITGETGSGKELAARWFHAKGPTPGGPFVAVNCATVPAGLAERLLFGARRGAYSGADADADGYLQTADGGTLFLDEIAELELGVQAKLLRVLETREVLPLGASKPRRVRLNVCSATHGDLRQRVASGTFREDLYFRLGRPDVAIPPLRTRREEIPWHAERAVGPLGPHASLVEAALLRPWPGNLRELLLELRDASRAAAAQGSAQVEARHLGERAGQRSAAPAATEIDTPAEREPPPREAPDREQIVEVLRREGGNVTRAARALGTHRTQLRRWIKRYEIDPAQQDDREESGD